MMKTKNSVFDEFVSLNALRTALIFAALIALTFILEAWVELAANPWRMLIATCFGVAGGVAVAPRVLALLHRTQTIGSLTSFLYAVLACGMLTLPLLAAGCEYYGFPHATLVPLAMLGADIGMFVACLHRRFSLSSNSTD